MSETKALSRVSIKDAEQGLVEAVFATLNVVDKDGDVTVKGAFEDGAAVRISAYGHTSWGGVLPVGKGTIHEADDEAVLSGQFFMDTPHGRDTFATVKGLGTLGEWSYGFDVLESGKDTLDGETVNVLRKLKVHEVSPVLLGAGVNTRTLAVKGRESFPDEAERVLGDVKSLVTRVEGWGLETGQKEGRVLSAANRERLVTLVAALAEAGVSLEQLLADTDPNKGRDMLIREFARYQRLVAPL